MRRRLRVCYLVSRLSRTGPTRQLLSLIKHLDKDRFIPTIITLSSFNDGDLIEDFGVYVDDIAALEFEGFLDLYKAPSRFAEVASPKKIELVHSHGIRADLVNSFLPKRNYRRIATQRNFPPDDYRLQYGRVRGAVLSLVQYFAFRNLDQVVTCSATLNGQNGRRLKSTATIRNGSEVPDLCSFSTTHCKSMLPPHLGIEEKTSLYIASGPLIKRKSIHVVIDSFHQAFKNASLSPTLLILGDGDAKPDLVRLAEKNSNIIFAGQVSDTAPYLRSADAFISASSSEGFPNAVLESLMNGTPVILSDIPAHLEILGESSLFGTCFQSGNINQLARSLREWSIGETERKVIQDNAKRLFSAQQMSNRYQSLYLRLAGLVPLSDDYLDVQA